MKKRERILKAFNNEPVDRVPVGFWLHFLQEEEFNYGLERPGLIEESIAAHKKFIEETDPDFVKIMSDGYFLYPSQVYKNLTKAGDLRNFKPLGKEHPWIQGQVRLAKAITQYLPDTSGFYNIFSPTTLLRFAISNEKFLQFFREDPQAVAYALDVIAQDIGVLSELVIKEGGAEGIYLSVQNPDNAELTFDEYRSYITPSEKFVLAAANGASVNNILHCCGYNGNKNNLLVWKDYEAKAVNWAVTIEGLDLGEGKKFFGGRAVIGGFDNRSGKLLDIGTKEEIQNFTEAIIAKAGKVGIIIGADCTVPRDIKLERLQWVKDKVNSL